MDHEETAPCPIYKGPDEGFQISCDSCLKWYHGRCVGQYKKNAIWHCPLCCGYWTGVWSRKKCAAASMKADSVKTEKATVTTGKVPALSSVIHI